MTWAQAECMNWALIIGCGLFGFGLVVLLIPLILKGAERFLPHRVEPHHTQKNPIPRSGGLVLALAFVANECLVAVLFPESRSHLPGRSVLIAGSLAMFALGFVDDVRPLGARVKLLGQVLVALGAYYAGVGIQSFKIPFTETIIGLGGWGVPLTVVWLVGMTNLINLIDGVDGLAGGISFMLMGLLVYLGHATGSFELLSAGMAGALLGFLFYNFPPARIYLGDGGAYLLGFQIGMLSLLSSNKGTVFGALAAPLFVLALPIVDTTLAILRRGLRGLPVFRPDQRHLHHQLLRLGHSRRRVVLSFYAATLVFLAMGFAAYWSRGQLVPILMGVAVVLLLLFAGRLSFGREWFAVGRVLGNSLAMRQEVQYALSLIRWIEHEGDRAESAEALFGDLVFASRKLGFTQVSLKLSDGQRIWRAEGYSETATGATPTPHVVAYTEPGRDAQRTAVYELQPGCGTLEFGAPNLCPDDDVHAGKCRLKHDGAIENCPCISDPRLFEILGELLAEGWMKAAKKLQAQKRGALVFTPQGLEPAESAQAPKPHAAAPISLLPGKRMEGEAGL